MREKGEDHLLTPGKFSTAARKRNLHFGAFVYLDPKNTDVLYTDWRTNSCLHYLLPQPRTSVNNRLKKVVSFPPPRTRTLRFSNSFIPFALSNYQ